MQTPVRFYITQADDQPVVRTTPVARPVRTAADEAAERDAPRAARQAPEGVSGRVRSLILRRGGTDTR